MREAFRDFVDTKGIFEIDWESRHGTGTGGFMQTKEIELNGQQLLVYEPSGDFENILVTLNAKRILDLRCAQNYSVYGTNVIGLLEYEGHWLMEVMCNKTTDIYLDGQSLNYTYHYSASFSPYFISGKLFYFFYRDDAVGYYYDGQEYFLNYDFIYYYHCCEIASYSPEFFTDHVEFNAVRGGDGSDQDNSKHHYNVVMGVAESK